METQAHVGESVRGYVRQVVRVIVVGLVEIHAQVVEPAVADNVVEIAQVAVVQLVQDAREIAR